SAERAHRRADSRPRRFDVGEGEPHVPQGDSTVSEPRASEQGDRANRYIVISADCHAGLPNARYRDWLDPGHREAFDEYLRRREAMLELAGRGLLNEEFAEQWEAENEEGLRG